MQAAQSIGDWFTPLNPYEQKERLLKVEDINFGIGDEHSKRELVDLFCLATSAKRTVLFRLDEHRKPIIQKASAHGLGHLLPPYKDEDAPTSIPAPQAPLEAIGVARWQYDLWYQIILAAMAGHPDRVDLSYHPALDRPAVSRYAATTPQLLKWFRIHNEKLAYTDQVRPFNFLSAFQASRFPSDNDDAVSLGAELQTKGRPRRRCVPKPIAPYDADSARASKKCFDRETGKPVPASQLKTYRQALAQYHLSPEPKFLGAEHLDRGPTRRRHVQAISTEHIGKEANRWEEQYYLGLNLDMQIEYGADKINSGALREKLRASKLSSRQLADATSISRNDISAFRRGKSALSQHQLQRLFAAVKSGDSSRAAGPSKSGNRQ